MTTPNGMLMGMGGNWVQDQFSWKGGTAWGDIFMENIDHGNKRWSRAVAADHRVRRPGTSGADGAPRAGSWTSTGCCTTRRYHSRQWADKGYFGMLWAARHRFGRHREGGRFGRRGLQVIEASDGRYWFSASRGCSAASVIDPEGRLAAAGIRRPDHRWRAGTVDRHTVRRGVPGGRVVHPGCRPADPGAGQRNRRGRSVDGGGPCDGLRVTEPLPDGFDWRTAEEVTLIVTAPEGSGSTPTQIGEVVDGSSRHPRTRSAFGESAGSIRSRSPSRTAGHC